MVLSEGTKPLCPTEDQDLLQLFFVEGKQDEGSL